MVYRLIVEGTIEDNIVKLQEKKKELADQILAEKEWEAQALPEKD